jgi:cytochrome P450
MLMTNLSPVRLAFDSLSYMTTNAAKYGELFGIYVGDTVTYVVSSPELAHEILVARANEFHKAEMLRRSVGALIGNGLLTSEGDFWKRQRKLSQPAFHFQRIEKYGETMVQQTQDLLAKWGAGEMRDIAHDMMGLTLGIVTKTLFNVNVRNQADRIGGLMHTVLEAANDSINQYYPVWERLFKTRQKRTEAAMDELLKLVEDIIAEHRKSGEDTGDLLSMLLAARDDDGSPGMPGTPMSERQLRDEVMTLFIAGHETSANALAWLLYLVSQHPEVEAKLMAEIATLNGKPPTMRDLPQLPYSEMVTKEVMRLYPPAGGATREPLHDIELGGYRLPKGASIAISTYTMHRNPKYFADPLTFDPERFSPENEPKILKYAYLPFGGGPRVCIGNSFAMMEVRLVAMTILQRFKLSLASNQKVRAEQLFTIRPKGGLKMVVSSRAA